MLQSYLGEIVQARKAMEEDIERYDLFSCLLKANEHEDTIGGAKLTNDELFGSSLLLSC
jgi:hypothetical protein